MAENGEVRDNDGETEQHSEELRIYDEAESYLANGSYPVSATKMEKGVIRKRAKKFHLVYVDGVLHYKEMLKGGQQRLRQVLILLP